MNYHMNQQMKRKRERVRERNELIQYQRLSPSEKAWHHLKQILRIVADNFKLLAKVLWKAYNKYKGAFRVDE